MTLGDSIKSCLDNYCVFKGRAPISEYWWMVLFSNVFEIVTGALFFLIGLFSQSVNVMVLSSLLGVSLSWALIFLPMLSVTVRRLHDTNHSGWWIFITLVPLVGEIWFLILMLQGSDNENQYGYPVY